MNVSYDYAGRIVLVTGGASGIGRAVVEGFAAAGATVVLADINAEAAATTAAAVSGKVEPIAVDVSDPAAVQAAIDDIIARHGRLDIAVNNAGIEGHHVPLADLPTSDFDRLTAVNLGGVFHCLKAEIPAMLAGGGGAIVNTASASGLIGGYNLAIYTATKHGVVGLTRAAAMDYGNKGIRINALCPGAIDTPFLAELPQPFLDRLKFGTPMDRLGRADEMAQAVLWLCSDGASYVTGHALAVDGGTVLGGMGTRFDDLI